MKLRMLLIVSTVVLLLGWLQSMPVASAARSTRSAFPLTVVDDRGNHVRIAHRPQRIVTLFADYTEIVFALGIERRLVGDGSHYAEGATDITNAAGKPRNFRYPSEWPSHWGRDYPVKSVLLPHVEGGFGGTPFNLETIESLKPDLILAPYYPSQTEAYAKMHDLGFTVLFLNPANLAGIYHDITLIGRVTGESSHARTLITAMKGELHDVQRKLARFKSRPAVYYEVDASNAAQPITAGPGTVIDAAIRLAGGRNIADSAASCSGTACYPAFSLESLVGLNPRVIILSDAAYGITIDSVKARPGWGTISAVQSGKIYPINPDLLSRFGPRVVIGISDLARLIHPAAFGRRQAG